MKNHRKERLVSMIVAVGVLLLFLLATLIIVSHFQNIDREKAKHLGQLELQALHEQLYSTFLQQTMFLKVFSATVSRELAVTGTVAVEDLSYYNNLLQETNEYFSSIVLIPRQEIQNILPADLVPLEDLLKGQNPLFFGPYQTQNNDFTITGCQAIPLYAAKGEDQIWGYVALDYNFSQVLQGAGIKGLSEDYTYAIRTKDSTGLSNHIFGDETLFEDDFLHMSFSFSLLNWELIFAPLPSSFSWSRITILLSLAGIMMALFMTLVSYNLTKRLLFIKRQAYSDDMTGFLNKTEFMRLLKKEIDYCNRTDSRLALALLDIDNFKEINDRYGHTEGDRALLALVHKISLAVHRHDVLGRFGGDEFAIIFRNMEVETAPYLAAKRVFQSIGKLEIEVGFERVKVQTSMGIAISGIDGLDAQTLFQRADAALYTAKVNGKNMLAYS